MTIEARLENMQNQLSNVIELLQFTINSLNTKKAVAMFLNKSERTIENYIKNKTFIRDKHYFINEKNKVEFLPLAIVEFKRNPTHKLTFSDDIERTETKVLSESASSVLKGLI